MNGIFGGRLLGAFGRGRGIPIAGSPVKSPIADSPFIRSYGTSNEGNNSGFGRKNQSNSSFFDKKEKKEFKPEQSKGRGKIEGKIPNESIFQVLKGSDEKIVQLQGEATTAPVGRGRGAPMSGMRESGLSARREVVEETKPYKTEGFNTKMEGVERESPDFTDNVEQDEEDEVEEYLKALDEVPPSLLTPYEKIEVKWGKTFRATERAYPDPLSMAELDDDTSTLWGPSTLSKLSGSDPEGALEQALLLGERYYMDLLTDSAEVFKRIHQKRDRASKAMNTIHYNQRERKRQHKAKRLQAGITSKKVVLPLPRTADEHLGIDLSYLIRDVPLDHPVHAFAKMVSQNPNIPIGKKRMMVSSYMKEMEDAKRVFSLISPNGESIFKAKKLTITEYETMAQ